MIRDSSRRPSHSDSGVLLRRRRAPRSDASTSSQSRFLRPGRDLADRRPSRSRRRRSRTGARPRPRWSRRAPRRRSSPRANAARCSPRRRSGIAVSVRALSADDPVAGDELGEVAPVRPDVGERARRAAELGVDAPVVVVGAKQPVLEVGAVDEVDGAALAARDALARLAHGRVVAVGERDGGADRLAGGQLAEPLGVGDRGRERLLADDVLARRERELGRARRAGGSACRRGRRRRRGRRPAPRRCRSRARRRAARPRRASARAWTRRRPRPSHRPPAQRGRGRLR